eukprot:1686352-Amphidinium_carterae.1
MVLVVGSVFSVYWPGALTTAKDYTRAILGLGQHGLWQEVQFLLSDAASKQVQGDARMNSGVATAYANAVRWGETFHRECAAPETP